MKETKETKETKEIDIEFNVTGIFSQTIQIHTKDTPEQFVEKLNNGTYLTTLSADCEGAGNVLELVDGDFKKVGKIVYIDAGDSEYDNFALTEDDITADPDNDIDLE